MPLLSAYTLDQIPPRIPPRILLAFNILENVVTVYFVEFMLQTLSSSFRISREILLASLRGTQITSDLGTRGGYRGRPKTRQPYWKGIPISLGIWVRGYPKHGETQITVTAPFLVACEIKPNMIFDPRTVFFVFIFIYLLFIFCYFKNK